MFYIFAENMLYSAKWKQASFALVCVIFAENSCMNLQIKILVLLITLLLFGGCSSEVNYSSQIINYDFNQLDGVLIYNRDVDVTIFELFRVKGSGLVFVDNQLRITKKPKNYPLQDNMIIKVLPEFGVINT